ncbi:COMPASS (complex proteins associated with Set1p) component [Conoideocrella luteorostrata]|uniref:COMPASS (Complex proteins associated with Set1p) component n=1 Tax=Conoideocrella luteorostrata TaxID=1105319 RepID=A0AAJ0CC27_9HYPO|nr:COMPASS (complex proteins associated with Set1p) component [Conoideocrella luteorostrata]
MADEALKPATTPEASGVSATMDKASESNQPPLTSTPQKDVVMSDAPIEQAASPLPANLAPSPAPGRTGTPAQGSRAASVHPDPGFTMPSEAPAHGDSTRRYLNTKVTGVLLEGMKKLAKDQPNDPLRSLGEYLIQRSKELEGAN